MHIRSSVFRNNDKMPVRYTGEGQDISPPLTWSEAPRETQEFALICEDPDAPIRAGKDHPFIHWMIYGIPPSITSLPEGLLPQIKIIAPFPTYQGVNSFGKAGYGGPLPPMGHGPHHYIFRLYALSMKSNLQPGVAKDEFLRTIQSRILATTEIVATYERVPYVKSA